MKKQTPFLDFYKECVKAGDLMPNCGLCNNKLPKVFVRKFSPTRDDNYELVLEGNPTGHWAHGIPYDVSPSNYNAFTPLRKTIVLFCAAINGEL